MSIYFPRIRRPDPLRDGAIGEFPGTTQLHNGICDTCQKLTHGPNYRLIAELNRKAEEVERKESRIDELVELLRERSENTLRLREALADLDEQNIMQQDYLRQIRGAAAIEYARGLAQEAIERSR